jgi:hypothetical protein
LTADYARTRLDEPPAKREIGIPFRQGPDRVQVVWEDNDRVNRKWMPSARVAKSHAQRVDMLREQPKAAFGRLTVKK